MAIIFTLFLAALSVGSVYKDWYRPEYLEDENGNREFPMPFGTMVASVATAVLNLITTSCGILRIGGEVSVWWAILTVVVVAIVIASEVIPNRYKWELMNWTTVALTAINAIVFLVLTCVY